MLSIISVSLGKIQVLNNVEINKNLILTLPWFGVSTLHNVCRGFSDSMNE